MRKLAALNQINGQFRHANVQKDMPGLEELVQCQSRAIEMGNCLETLGEEAEPVVHMLEDYCENIYQQSICLNDAAMCRNIAKKIQKQLNLIGNAIRFDLPEGKKEILFLPYKAAMWDSLESVWMAAREDEDCEAIVMPIPYFDKNPDGTLGQMHDEKDCYPKYVPITDWQEYDLAERRPDAIYIHNPYDNNNYVTSVHPIFYAKELKKCTDMLVYIPYFMGVDDSVGEHLFLQPGVLLADRVIVENEAIRKVYLEGFIKYCKKYHIEELLCGADQKFLALGSPKMDRVRRMMREGVAVPEAWEKLIRKEDGSGKKVILYNTSLDAFLHHSEIAIDKIARVLQTFRDNPEVILLWRPHPLLLSTVQALREELYWDLLGLIQAYKDAGWGIYDDTADVDRAIVLSDAYYGDGSSVVTLYRATGKPVMIQNYEE